MRLAKPRIPPLNEQEWSEVQRELLTRGNPSVVLNVFRTIIRHVDLYRRWLPFGNHVLYKSSLAPRERELLILRVGHLCKSDYEFHHHVTIGKRAGLTHADIEFITAGAVCAHLNSRDRLLIRAVDELHQDFFINEATWAELALHYNTNQLMDLVFTVGQYTMMSMALNSFGVQLEVGATPMLGRV